MATRSAERSGKKSSKSSSKTKNIRISSGSKTGERAALLELEESTVLQVSEENKEEPTASGTKMVESAVLPTEEAKPKPTDSVTKMAESTAVPSKMGESTVLQASEKKKEEATDSAGQAQSLVSQTAASAIPAEKDKIAERPDEQQSEAAMTATPAIETATKAAEMAEAASMQPWEIFDDAEAGVADNAWGMAGDSSMQAWEMFDEAVGGVAENAEAAGSSRNPWASIEDTAGSRTDVGACGVRTSSKSADDRLQVELDAEMAASLAAEPEEDMFEDALDEDDVAFSQAKTFTLMSSFDDCSAAMQKFFENDIPGAMEVLRPLSFLSLYHSLGMSIFLFIPAILTFDKGELQKATKSIKNCIHVCNKYRKTFSFAQSLAAVIKKPKYTEYTDMQAHAELCFAEVSLLQAALTIAEGDDYASYINAVFKLKSSFSSYKICWEIKEGKQWDSEDSQAHFESGVRLGTATFNLIISLLPPHLISILEFVGFSGSRMYGINELKKGACFPGLRAVLCDLVLLVYYLVLIPFTGGQGDVESAERIFQRILVIYPNSVWFRTLRARSEFLKGRLRHSITGYKLAMDINKEYNQFKIVCYWEIMWAHGLNLEFAESATYAQLLFQESAWSKTTHLYIKAAMLMQMDIEDVTFYHRDAIANAIRQAPIYRNRIAGKSLPMEKFIVKRCERFYRQACRLTLPAFEILNHFNKLHVLANNKDHLAIILRIIQKTRTALLSESKAWMGPYEYDNLALVYYLHACALCAMDQPKQAMTELLNIMEIRKEIKEDTFLIPYAKCEMALAYFQMGNMQAAMEKLHEVKKKYSGYALETRLQFRIQAREELVRTIIGDSKFTPGVPGIKVETHFR